MTLRPMEMKDADFILSLKNYMETRAFAIVTHGEIKKEDHYKYLEDNIQYFQVIEFSVDERAGVIRIKDNEISIWIDRKFWGKGIASFILEQCEKGCTAKIVEGNIFSMRAFINAGFKPVSYFPATNTVVGMRIIETTGYYIFKR